MRTRKHFAALPHRALIPTLASTLGLLILAGSALGPALGAAEQQNGGERPIQAAPRPDGIDYEGLVRHIGRGAREHYPVPGLALAVQHGADRHVAGTFGYAELEHAIELSPQMLLPLGTLSHLVTAALVLARAEAGELDLEAPLVSFLPATRPLGEDLTVKQLLAHTSGLPDYTHLGRAWREARLQPVDLERFVEFLTPHPRSFEPDTDFEFCNSNAWLLGALLEELSGSTYAREVKAKLAEPLGLGSLVLDDPQGVVSARAHGYRLDEEGYLHAPRLDPSWTFAAAGLAADPTDATRLFHALLGGLAFGEHGPAVARRLGELVTLPDGRVSGHGLGAARGRLLGSERLYAEGHTLGHSAFVAHYPGEELTVLVVANAADLGLDAIERSLTRAILDVIPPVAFGFPLEEEAARIYEGRYRFVGFELEFHYAEDALRATWPSGHVVELLSHGEHTFGVEFDPEMRITFLFDPDSPPRCRVEQSGGMRIGVPTHRCSRAWALPVKLAASHGPFDSAPPAGSGLLDSHRRGPVAPRTRAHRRRSAARRARPALARGGRGRSGATGAPAGADRAEPRAAGALGLGLGARFGRRPRRRAHHHGARLRP